LGYRGREIRRYRSAQDDSLAVVTATPTPGPPPAGAPGSRRRVVIAEDEALIRLDLAEMLVEEGWDVVGQAEDGEKALELVLDQRPDLVILDVKMPRLDGIAAAERIAGQRLAPVVILTAFSQRDLVERARDAGAMAYLVKPFDQNDLVPAIEMAVSRFTELRQLEAEVEDLNERLETRKAVDRAKGILQQSLGLSEPESFRWIQKTAMDLRLSMRQVAEGVVAHGPAMTGPTTTPAEPGQRS
jgi:AmiR/NasT family two-component response regulator